MTTCFVIGPIGDKFAPVGSEGRNRYEEALEVFEKVILPACSQAQLEAIRADQIAISGEITEQVFRHLYEDDVVIADLTGGNPNVMYELGLRHTRDLLTIQISEYGQLPFDIAGGRTIQFSRSERGLIDARKALLQAISAGLAEGPDPITATRSWNSPTSSGEDIVQRLVELQEVEEPVEDLDYEGFLERMVQVEETFPVLTETLGAIGDLLAVIGGEGDEAAREMNALNETQPSAAARLRYVTGYSKKLQTRADELNELSETFTAAMGRIDTGVIALIEFLRENPDRLRDDPDAAQFLDGLIDVAKSGRSGFEDLSQFASVIASLAPMSKSMRKPAYQIADSVRRMAKAAVVMDEWESAANRIKKRALEAAESAG